MLPQPSISNQPQPVAIGGTIMALQRPTFVHEDLAHMPDDGKRYELYEGELIVSPAPVTKHQSCSMQLSGLLWRAEEAGYGRAFADFLGATPAETVTLRKLTAARLEVRSTIKQLRSKVSQDSQGDIIFMVNRIRALATSLAAANQRGKQPFAAGISPRS